MILEQQHAFPFLAGVVLGIQACDHVARPLKDFEYLLHQFATHLPSIELNWN
jgi:hypothetical protein